MVSTPARSPAKPCLRALITSSLAMRLRGTAASRLIPSCSHWRSDRKSTRLNSSHGYISYAVFCLKKKKKYKDVKVKCSLCSKRLEQKLNRRIEYEKSKRARNINERERIHMTHKRRKVIMRLSLPN